MHQGPCNDKITAANGLVHKAVCIGDVPVSARDTNGVKHYFKIKNVRCLPSFTNTLLSVDQLWQLSNFDVRFGNLNQLQKIDTHGGVDCSAPFVKRRGLFIWDIKVNKLPSRVSYVAHALSKQL
jgi:hypothetical protein